VLRPRRDDLTFLGKLGGTNVARLNRLEVDLSSFAGRQISLDVLVDAGPDAEGDLVVWPDLKLYRRTSLPRVRAHAAAVAPRDDSTGVPRTAAAASPPLQPRCFLKNAIVRSQASLAFSASYRAVESLWNPWLHFGYLCTV